MDLALLTVLAEQIRTTSEKASHMHIGDGEDEAA
jgi:hypothetical protein